MIVTGISLVAMGLMCVAAFALLMVFLMWANPGTNSGFLEWDPEAHAVWRGDVERDDLVRLLEERNAERAARGLEPQSLDEMAEELRRRGEG